MTSPQLGQPPKAKKQKREKPLLESLPSDGHPGHSKFARALASTDYQTREKGLHALKFWLLRKTDLHESDMSKIWKGLFYCFWHSDKAPVQAELAERLAAILTQLPEQSAYLYFTAFMATMRREWFGIDRLRMDKFLMLIRKFIHHMLGCLKASKWHADLVQRYADYLHHHVVLPGDTLPAAGVAYHCSDVFLDELRGVADGKSIPASALSSLLSPFMAALQNGEQAVLQRIGEGLFDTLLSELASPTDDSHYLQKLDVTALAAQLFERGASPGTRARNRQVLYDLSGALEKLQRKRQRVDEGAQAGPSSRNEETPKATKKQLKAKRAAVAAAAAAEAIAAAVQPSAANGDLSHVQMEDAPAVELKRKAKASDSTAPEPGQHEGSPAGNGNQKPETAKRKKLGSKKQRAVEMAQNGGSALEAATSPVNSAPASAKAGANGHGAGASHKEPTSGQKAALRASVAKLSASLDAAASAAHEPTKQKKSPGPAHQEPLKDDGAVAQHASTPGSASAAKPSALGKRPTPGSTAKAGPATAQKVHLQGNGAAATAKTPVQPKEDDNHGGRSQAVTTAKKGRVVINLKRNLYFEHGGPIPNPDLRTPPPARAKGGILKKTAQSCPPKVALASAPNSTAKQGHCKQASSKPTVKVLPKQARRASASLFF